MNTDSLRFHRSPPWVFAVATEPPPALRKRVDRAYREMLAVFLNDERLR